MSLLNRAYSGFFPFWTVPYSRLPSGWGYAMPLAALTQCHWLAKSATLTAALNYSLTTHGEDRVPNDITSVIAGTIGGSGTISDGLSGSALMALTPGQRAAWAGTASTDSGLIFIDGYTVPIPAYLVDSGTITTTDTSHPSEDSTSPYSQALASFELFWFAGMPLADTLSPQGPVAFDQPNNKWYTDLGCMVSGGLGPAAFEATPVNGGTSGASFILIADGVTLATIPLVCGSAGLSLTGNITLAIDTFWTP